MIDYVLVIDSGVGGVSVLNALLSEFPQLNYIYFADSKFAPYGNKTRQQLINRLKSIIDRLTNKYSIQLIVLACNTATASCLDTLQQNYCIPIIGIYPAIKTALALTDKKVLVMATVGTINNSKVVKEGESEQIILSPQKDLAYLIDSNLGNLSCINNDIKKILAPYTSCDIGAVVLGCTHYVFVKDYISQVLGDVKFCDGSEAVVEQVKQTLGTKSLLQKGELIVKNSLNDNKLNTTIKKYIKSL